MCVVQGRTTDGSAALAETGTAQLLVEYLCLQATHADGPELMQKDWYRKADDMRLTESGKAATAGKQDVLQLASTSSFGRMMAVLRLGSKAVQEMLSKLAPHPHLVHS
jgi:hypothetical protein